ncbi:hypothetical protein HZA97_09445 [Candidatus Woesearchaeota archaeon]|nr:hypothetical protein [Candidatus Woesearchaeota archaeon]
MKIDKIKEWLTRYGLAEIIGTIFAYAGFFLVQILTNNIIVSAYAGAIGENIGFYGTILIREVINDLKITGMKRKKYGLIESLKTATKLCTEFGPAEILDSLVIRPASMGFGANLLGRKIGVMVGKLIADIIFYIPTIVSYELRKHF